MGKEKKAQNKYMCEYVNDTRSQNYIDADSPEEAAMKLMSDSAFDNKIIQVFKIIDEGTFSARYVEERNLKVSRDRVAHIDDFPGEVDIKCPNCLMQFKIVKQYNKRYFGACKELKCQYFFRQELPDGDIKISGEK